MRYAMERRYTMPIQIERKTKIELDLGGYTEDWFPIHDFLGYIRPLTGKEIIEAQQLKRQTTHRLYMPVKSFLPSDRVVHNDIAYNILYSHNPNQADEFLQVDLELTSNG